MNIKNMINLLNDDKPKKSMPILSFPCISLMDISVNDLVNSSLLQAEGMKKIADEVEADPKDRNKTRKLANHYVGMLIDLVDKYILLQKQAADGANITTSIAKIEEALAGADVSLAKLLDDLFTDEAMEVSADIAVLENLLSMEGSQATMDFSAIE